VWGDRYSKTNEKIVKERGASLVFWYPANLLLAVWSSL
jgi:hypothetical protein